MVIVISANMVLEAPTVRWKSTDGGTWTPQPVGNSKIPAEQADQEACGPERAELGCAYLDQAMMGWDYIEAWNVVRENGDEHSNSIVCPPYR